MHILWHTPDKPDSISSGRERIADQLRSRGATVTVRGTTPSTIRTSLAERDRYDALVGTTRSGALLGMALRLAGDMPFVVDHVDPIRQFYETCSSRAVATAVEYGELLAMRLADETLFVYDEEHARVRRRASNATQTRLPIKYDQFASPSDATIDGAESLMPDADNVAVYIGGLEPCYNLDELYDAIDRLDDWELLILGTGSLEADVQSVSDERDDVHYEGSVPHDAIPGVLHRADAGVSLVDDPHTLKVLEYLAAGLPAVQVGGHADTPLGEYVTKCTLQPESIADALRSARVFDDGREFARQHAVEAVAADYTAAIERAVGAPLSHPDQAVDQTLTIDDPLATTAGD